MKYPQVYCYAMPIVKYAYMIGGVYKGKAYYELLRWKLKDNYTFRENQGSE